MNYPNIVGTPYDYSKKKYWMDLPKRPAKPKKKVDCIWLSPTSSMANAYIGPVDPVMKFMAKDYYREMGVVFNKHCNILRSCYHLHDFSNISTYSFLKLKSFCSHVCNSCNFA